MGYIYRITNLINYKVYIGKTTTTINQRWNEHIRSAKRNPDRALYRAFFKYGVNNFVCDEIEHCDNSILEEREQYWIKYYNSFNDGYNMTIGGDGSILYDFSFDELYTKYIIQNLSAYDIANEYGCSVDIVYDRLKDYNIHKSTKEVIKNKKSVCTIYEGVPYKFNSRYDAARWCLENHFAAGTVKNIAANIGRCCNGIRKTACGLQWFSN